MKVFILLAFISSNCFAFDHEHKTWGKILSQFTRLYEGQVQVNYKSIKIESSLLKTYLSELEAVTKADFKDFSEQEKLAFWINAYNAYTVKLIVDNYPVKSIKDLGSLFSSPWSKKFFKLLGKKMSLDGIEHDTIRKEFKEARIHFAVNCASIGCPSLYREAFVASKLDEQLEAATQFFLSNRSKNNIKKNTLYLSKIFKWYGGDFDKYHGSVKNFVTKYYPEAKNAKDISYLEYNWNLNEY